MVILFTAPYYEKKGECPKGGYTVYLRRVTGALKELGHTPIILSCGTQDLHYTENGVEIYFIRSSHRQSGTDGLKLAYSMLYNSWIINRKIAELVRERKIDIIQFTSQGCTAVCYYGKTPAVMRLSCYSKIYSNNKGDIKALFERISARRCSAVFAPSNVNADAFSKDIHRNVSVIESPFWNDCEICDDSVYNKRLIGKKYFLFYGRLVVDKGILVIADSLQYFLESNPEYYFVCCGIEKLINGKNPVNILQKAAGQYAERFIFIKELPHKLLYPVIQHADFVIFPSLIENLSNACIEAMYFERVVIGTDGASFEQLIDDGKSGLLCKPNDADSLLRKMNEAVAMNELQKLEMGKNARKRIDRLAPEFVVKKLIRYYRYIIDHTDK